MRFTSCITITFFMEILSNAYATKGIYTVIAPGTIHCNEKYTAAVAVHQTSEPCYIKVGITGRSYNVTQLIEVAHNEVRSVDFLLPCFENVDFNLTAEGIDCMNNFKSTTKLIYKKFNNHVRIQADKDFYEPGDYINFRVLFLDKNLRPVQPEKDAVIWIEDGQRNRIKEIKGFGAIKGVYSGKFKISDFPVRGGWQLGVRNGGEFDRTLHFGVDKYILPKIVVKVEATKLVSVKDGDMQVIVRANYNYGTPFNGRVSVELFLESKGFHEITEPPILGKVAEIINGKAKLDFNVKEYAVYLPYKSSPSYITVVATVEEKVTGIKINSTASTTIYPYRYFMNCINCDGFATFDVDKEKDILLQITYLDGSYLNDTKSIIELTCKEILRKNDWSYSERTLDNGHALLSEKQAASFKGHLNETGFIAFKVALVDLPQHEGYLYYYSLELKYLDEQREVYTTYRAREPKSDDAQNSKEYFTLEPKYGSKNKLYLKKASQFVLNSSQPLSYFDYNVIGRGNILKSRRIILHGKPKVYNLTLTPQFLWAPSFCVYANYIDESGEYHYAEQQYDVVLELENKINITVSKQAKPGEEVAFKIQTVPNSFVGLTAVAQTVFQLRSENDLNFYELDRVLGSYTTHTFPQGDHSTFPGEISGCVTFTNADYYYSTISPKNVKRDLFLEANKGASMYSNSSVTTDATHLIAHKGILETWFFADIEETEGSEFTWTEKVPKTMTSWILTAFSMNPRKGLGVTREKSKITTFQAFFISIRLPYSVKRGEVINVPALVYNYLGKALDVEVTLENTDDEYEFIEFDNEIVNEQKLSKSIRVPGNEGAGVSFLIKPKVVGNIVLRFTAISPVATDTVHKSMKVILEGTTLYANRAYFVNLSKWPEFKALFVLEFPQDCVPDSKRVEVGVTGDILGPVLKNLDNLVHVATGCCEQTMSALLPNYLVMKYLKDSKRLTPTVEIKLRYNLETGYQTMLYYRHTDGSFSTFGRSQIKGKPRNGSTWLTAYVVRSLQQIKEFIYVDDKIIEKGLAYLSKQQSTNGTFTENGDYLYESQRNHIVITGAAVLGIFGNSTYVKKYWEELNKGLDFIAQNIRQSDSLLAQAIGTFTLNKARHTAAQHEVSKLRALAKTPLEHTRWSAEEQRCGRRWWYNVFCNDVEITSYILLTLLDQEFTDIDDVLPIIKWLVGQRTSYGGFASTPATVVGLTALIEFAKFANYAPAKMTVDIESKEKNENIILTEDNGILYQNIEMPSKTTSIQFTAKGTSLAFVQISYQCNVFQKNPTPSFTIKTIQIRNKVSPFYLEILVCLTYVSEGESSNMALMEFYTPSGYVIYDENLKDIKNMKIVANTELKNSDTLLVVYFDHLYKNDRTCFLVQAIRTHAVAMQKPAPIVLYEYNDTSKRDTAFYEVESTLCDICETKEECSRCK